MHNLTVRGLATYHAGPDGVVVHNCGFSQLFKIKFEHFIHRKGWDKIIGKTNPSQDEVAEVIERLVVTNAGSLKDGVTTIRGMHNGHSVYIQVSSRRSDGLYEITSAGLSP